MSKLYTIMSKSTFYPLPTLNFQAGAIVFTPHPLFEKYYATYSTVLDKNYYMELYDKRYDVNPNPKFVEIWGDNEEVREWAAINTIMDDSLSGIVFRMFLLREDPFYFDEYLRVQTKKFDNLFMTDKILPHHRVIIDCNKPLSMTELNLACNITNTSQYYYSWNWLEIVLKSLNKVPHNGKVELINNDIRGKIVSNLISMGYEEVDESVWERRVVPSRDIHFG